MTLCSTVKAESVFRSILARKNKMSTKNNYSINFESMRAAYKSKTDAFLEDHLVSKEPMEQFKSWFEEARAHKEILEPNAMCLATCTKGGFPSARFVLLKGYGKDGFKFFTYFNSRKGNELNENPNAALTFYWEVLHRSIRVEGTVQKLSEEEATEYFHSRPKESQIGAACSNQSQPISARSALIKEQTELREKYVNSSNIPKPKEWGGYILKPSFIEFWQGQTDRLHDRIRFRHLRQGEAVDNVLLHLGEDGWVYERLQP